MEALDCASPGAPGIWSRSCLCKHCGVCMLVVACSGLTVCDLECSGCSRQHVLTGSQLQTG
jgi:hypothetical protein